MVWITWFFFQIFNKNYSYNFWSVSPVLSPFINKSKESIIHILGLFTVNSPKCYLWRDIWCSRRFVSLFKKYLLLELTVQCDAKSINTTGLQFKLNVRTLHFKMTSKLAKCASFPWIFINVQNALKGIINTNIWIYIWKKFTIK